MNGDNKNVSELNKRNTDRLSSVSSDNYFIPYGDKSRTQEPSDIVNNKGQKEKTKAKTDHATKTMHPMLQGNGHFLKTFSFSLFCLTQWECLDRHLQYFMSFKLVIREN